MIMKVSDYIAQYLHNKGISHIFEVIGGMTTHIIDSISNDKKISIISMHHEQAAGFAAEAFARQSNISPGIALATSGPGATNLITAIGSCYFDSVPVIFITGQVNSYELKKEKPIRQLGFQETDIVSIVKSITKFAYQVQSSSEVSNIFDKAFEIAMEGRKGPVLLDIPIDIQRGEIDVPQIETNEIEKASDNSFDEKIETILQNVLIGDRPLILAGGGIASSGNINLFRKFVSKFKIPVVNSLMATDALASSNINRVGLIGTYGNRWANLALDSADTLLVIGSRLDIRQTGANIQSFKNNKNIYQIDCDAGEITKKTIIDDCICMDIKFFLDRALMLNIETRNYDYWLSEINLLKEKYSDLKENDTKKGINPNLFIKRLSEESVKASTYVTDVGQNQIWSAQSLRLKDNQRFLTSGGMGAMGFSLPASIGSCFSSKSPVVSISGDGGFQMNIQELETISHHQLPIKIIILNNNSLGMVRQFQESYFNKNYQSTRVGYSAPSFSKIAEAYGIMNNYITQEPEITPAIKEMWANADTPFLLEVRIDSDVNSYPKLAFNKSFSEMEPYAQPEKF
jgi:acetolactate synthase-1/2/3 large subunit